MHSKASPLTPGCSEGVQHLLQSIKQGVQAGNAQKAQTLQWLSGTKKVEWGRWVAGCVISLCTIFWLVGGEIESQCHQPSGSSLSGVMCLWPVCSLLLPAGKHVSIYKTAQGYGLRYDLWHEFEQTPGDSGGQRNLACCSPWGHKESGTA